MPKPLTAMAAAKLKPSHKRYETRDSTPGLALVVHPSGSKAWVLRFRRPDGRTAKMTLGRFDSNCELKGDPVIGGLLTVAAARQLAAEVHRSRALGRDPIADRQAEQRTQAAKSAQACFFSDAAKRFVEEHARPRNRGWKSSATALGLAPAADGALVEIRGGLADRWRSKPVAEVSSADVYAVVAEAIRLGIPGRATKQEGSRDSRGKFLHACLSSMYSWAVDHRLASSNPCASSWSPKPPPARDRVLSDSEVRWLWEACTEAGEPFDQALRLLLLTGQRRNEVSSMRWTEVSGDTWTIPAERSKNKRAHTVPLSQPVVAILNSVHRVSDEFVFSTTGGTAVRGWSGIKSRLDAKMLELAREEHTPDFQIPSWRIHDLRRTVATNLQRLGVRLEVTEAILNHKSGAVSGIVAIYQRHEYDQEKRVALDAWAARLERIVGGKVTSNVVEMAA